MPVLPDLVNETAPAKNDISEAPPSLLSEVSQAREEPLDVPTTPEAYVAEVETPPADVLPISVPAEPSASALVKDCGAMPPASLLAEALKARNAVQEAQPAPAVLEKS
jgi:hypothetical protein